MNKIVLTLSLLCCSTLFCENNNSDDDSGNKNSIYHLFERFPLEKLPSLISDDDRKKLETTFKTFIEETTFPLPSTSKNQRDKSKAALFNIKPTDSVALKKLIDRAHIENEYGKKANKQGNIAACIAPLMFVPLLRSVRSIGLIALGAWAASKMQAASYYPQYDMSMLKEAYSTSITSSTKK